MTTCLYFEDNKDDLSSQPKKAGNDNSYQSTNTMNFMNNPYYQEKKEKNNGNNR